MKQNHKEQLIYVKHLQERKYRQTKHEATKPKAATENRFALLSKRGYESQLKKNLLLEKETVPNIQPLAEAESIINFLLCNCALLLVCKFLSSGFWAPGSYMSPWGDNWIFFLPTICIPQCRTITFSLVSYTGSASWICPTISIFSSPYQLSRSWVYAVLVHRQTRWWKETKPGFLWA